MPMIEKSNNGAKNSREAAFMAAFNRTDVVILLMTGDQKFKNSGRTCPVKKRTGYFAINSFRLMGFS